MDAELAQRIGLAEDLRAALGHLTNAAEKLTAAAEAGAPWGKTMAIFDAGNAVLGVLTDLSLGIGGVAGAPTAEP